MRPGIACAVVVVGLAWAGVASAETLCVPDTTIPGCPATGSASEFTIGDAVTNGHNGDTILIGPHTFVQAVDDTGKSYHFVGEGETQTVIQGPGSPAVNISAGSSISNLRINLHDGPGNTGLVLAGTATNVAITATGPSSTMNNIGVDLVSGGSFTLGSVTLPVSGGDVSGYGGVVGSGTFADSTVTAAVGVTRDASFNIPTIHRARIVANEGVLDPELAFMIDDSLIKTVPGAAQEVGLHAEGAGITARHVTVIGSGGASSTGLLAESSGASTPETATVNLDSSIIRRYATSISSVAMPTPFPASTFVNVHYSDYDLSTTHISNGGVGGTATITPDAHSGNFDPQFVNPTAGDFHLKAGSPAIDGGDPAPLASGESSTDLDGHPRAIAGHNGDAAVSDVGAFEFQPHTPTVGASASPLTVAGGKPVKFTSTGSDPSPGDSVSFSWHFDDGANASGATVNHAFVKAGHHTATVTATDLDRFTAVARVTVIVIGPGISKLSIKPKRLRAGHRATISYRDSQSAKTTFKLFRVGSRHSIRTFSHRDRAGKNHLRFKAGKLAPGHYRLVAVPRNAAGAGPTVVARFRIVR